MKKILTFSVVLVTSLILFNVVMENNIAFAQEREYQLMAPLPFSTGSAEPQPGDTTTFSTYLEGMYQFFFAAAGILAVVMIILGGFQYATTDALQDKEDGRTRIRNAIIGLLLALGTWVILNTINPELLKFDLQIDRPLISSRVDLNLVTSCGTNCLSSYLLEGFPDIKPQIAGSQVDADLASSLVGLNSDLEALGVNWQITELYPPTGWSPTDPTGIHQHSCHGNGTCVDANFTGPNRANPSTADVQAFINAAGSNGARAVYETNNQAQYDSLVAAGIPESNIDFVPAITAPHFSIYNN